ncbi:polysaccharide pyruvyl transferase family protein [Jonesia quinghaiensis]|uniref:polysaccharide pyruvyl transferase family protein n=1 Tax=Jonesia quinghaiensis TaxID=262806 RepID=UPI000414C7F3|nr:polysaccharide pyruvyl transferase family protein [Jonesia quinghaiensis]
MTKILLRAGKSPFTSLEPEVALEGFGQGVWGSNVGNLIFGDSVHRLLSTPDVDITTNAFLTERAGVTQEYIAAINEQFDHFVIPLANAFRKSFLPLLSRLTDVIEQLTIPVTVVGVGVVGGPKSLEDPVPTMEPEDAAVVQRFVRAVLARSATIGVRGEYTAQFLKNLGFGDDVVRVVGCPSLFKFGPDLQITKKVDALTTDSAVTLNLTPYVKEMGAISLANVKKYRDLVYIPQITADLEMMMWGKNHEKYSRKELPVHVQHPLYVQDRMRFFVDSHTWSNYLGTRDFAFGTRIHGNIAALMAGTPAYVLAHDARTLELALHHGIPHTQVPDLAGRKDAAEFYDNADYSEFNSRQAGLFAAFSDFLVENNLEHIYLDGKANPEYDQRIAQTQYAGPVRALTSTDPSVQRENYDRIERLRSGTFLKDAKKTAKETMEFPMVPSKKERVAEVVKAPVIERAARKLKRMTGM